MALKFKGDKVVTQDLTVKPDPAIGNLCKVYLKSVEVEEAKTEKINEKTGQESSWEYAGYKIPYLKFTFVQEKKAEETRERYLKYNENIFTFVTKEGVPVEENTIVNLFTQMNDRIVHIHDAFKADPNYKAMGDIDFDEKGDVKIRIENFKKFFKAIANSFNKGKDDKPIYVDANNKALPLFVKVLPDYNTKRFYTLPTFVGKGFIERARGTKPMIELSASELANFELKVTSDKKEVTAGTANTNLQQENIDPAVMAILNKQ